MQTRAGAAIAIAMLACFVIPSPSDAAPRCRSNQQYVANWGCLSKAVIAQAKLNCRNGPAHSSKFTECLCEDTGKVGACGN
jgi:hypothetical protein